MRIEEKAAFPRPDFIRRDMASLNGTWEFAFDDDGSLLRALRAGGAVRPGGTIRVPFPYQSPESGVGDTAAHERVCYRRLFDARRGEGALLRFGAVDHTADVWLNGRYLGRHGDGYTPFCFEAGPLLRERDNELVVYATDPPALDALRGKQSHKETPTGCHYTPFTGIWQDVWLEYAPETHILSVWYETDFDRREAVCHVALSREASGRLTARVEKAGAALCELETTVSGGEARLLISLPDLGMWDNADVNWSPEHPNLFDVTLTFTGGDGASDTVETYFGLRKISVSDGRIYLNNAQLYLRMVLDQGYWPEGICRPADDDGYRRDVALARSLGFNGARKHQKIEDPRYYYWADRLGLLVWAETPSFYAFTEDAQAEMADVVRGFIRRDRNHPCVMAWVLFNESWGLRKLLGDPRQADFARSMYYLARSLDPSRPVVTNDGWENIFPTDIVTVHDYRVFDEALRAGYCDPAFLRGGAARTGHPYLLPGGAYGGEPIVMSEYGGRPVGADAAGLRADTERVLGMRCMAGYCYTQLTDVYQEMNGLADMNRTLKADAGVLRGVFSKTPEGRH